MRNVQRFSNFSNYANLVIEIEANETSIIVTIVDEKAKLDDRVEIAKNTKNQYQRSKMKDSIVEAIATRAKNLTMNEAIAIRDAI